MLLRLGLETTSDHAQADEDRLAAMNVTTRLEFRAFLARVYGFEAPVEHAVWHMKGLRADTLHGRAKCARLHRDLEALGLSANEIAGLATAPVKLRSTAHALGWLFVLERQSLVSGLIRRHVHRTLGDVVGGAFDYLSAYGNEPGGWFRAFGVDLGRYAQTYEPAAIVAGAHEAFRAQRHWYRARDPMPPKKPEPVEALAS
jgi:heme oxygenase